MKKLLAGALSLTLLAALLALPALAADGVPSPQSKTVTLPAECIDSTLGKVSVTVTYTGWLGELDGEANGITGDGHANDWSGGPAGVEDAKIIVVKEGSEIRFTIRADDPMAAYNYCYDGVYYDGGDTLYGTGYGWDDCGGGALFYDGANSSFPMQVYGTKSGASVFSAGPIFSEDMQPLGRKVGEGEYVYTPVNGLATYTFQAKEKREADGSFLPNGYTAKYLLGTVLTINDQQIKEMQETGTMTFLEGVTAYGSDLSYQHAYVGLAELLGGADAQLLQLRVSNTCKRYDTGLGYQATLTNTTTEAIRGCYALLSYFPRKYQDSSGSGTFYAQVQPIDVDLAPGKTVSLEVYSGVFGIANARLVWVAFEDEAERSAFLADDALNDLNVNYMVVEEEQWLKDNFGIAMQSAK